MKAKFFLSLLLSVIFQFSFSQNNLLSIQKLLQKNIWYDDGQYWEKNGVGRGYEKDKNNNFLKFDSVLVSNPHYREIIKDYTGLSGYYTWKNDDRNEEGGYTFISPNYIFMINYKDDPSNEQKGVLYKIAISKSGISLTSIIPNDFGYVDDLKKY